VKSLVDCPSCIIDVNGQLLGICLENRGPIGCLPLVDRISSWRFLPDQPAGPSGNHTLRSGARLIRSAFLRAYSLQFAETYVLIS